MSIAARLGIDPTDPEFLLAKDLATEDLRFLAELVRMRRESGKSQEEVARLLGLSQPTIAAFERHDNDPKLSTIRRYAQVVGVMVHHNVSPTSEWRKMDLPTSFVPRPALRLEQVKITAADWALAG